MSVRRTPLVIRAVKKLFQMLKKVWVPVKAKIVAFSEYITERVPVWSWLVDVLFAAGFVLIASRAVTEKSSVFAGLMLWWAGLSIVVDEGFYRTEE